MPVDASAMSSMPVTPVMMLTVGLEDVTSTLKN